jgi:hypothetical protein
MLTNIARQSQQKKNQFTMISICYDLGSLDALEKTTKSFFTAIKYSFAYVASICT